MAFSLLDRGQVLYLSKKYFFIAVLRSISLAEMYMVLCFSWIPTGG